LKIGKHNIGAGHPVYIVAELSANHNHDFDRAAKLVQAAKDVGADAVKLQTYTAETMTIASDQEYFRIGGGTLWDGRSLYALYAEAFMPWEWQPKLKKIAEDIGLDLFSTPFDSSAVEFLEQMSVPAHKIASCELVDIGLIQKVATTGKPLIMSTGMANEPEIDEAVKAARAAGAKEIVLLKCTSAYPAPPEEANLRTIPELARRFGCPAGLSDHTMEVAVPIAAVAVGACVIEKHLCLSRGDGGPDSGFSLEPHEFKAMIHAVRTAEAALGTAQFAPGARETKSLRYRRSLFVVQDVKKGESFTLQNVRSIRPADGLHPRYLNEIVGKRAARNIERGTPLSWTLIER